MQRCMCWPVLIGRKLDQEGISGRDKDVGSVFGFEGADPQQEYMVSAISKHGFPVTRHVRL